MEPAPAFAFFGVAAGHEANSEDNHKAVQHRSGASMTGFALQAKFCGVWYQVAEGCHLSTLDILHSAVQNVQAVPILNLKVRLE